MVVNLVNDVSDKLLKKYPALHLQFGLHATSVKNHLDIIKNTNKNIHIIWEDIGSFPFNYDPDDIKNLIKHNHLSKTSFHYVKMVKILVLS